MMMSTFPNGVDLTGKTVLPFVTSAVSAIMGIDDDHCNALPAAQVGAGLAVRGEVVTDPGADVDRWFADAGLA